MRNGNILVRTKFEVIVDSLDEMDDEFSLMDLTKTCSDNHKGMGFNNKSVGRLIKIHHLAERIRQLDIGQGSIWRKLS